MVAFSAAGDGDGGVSVGVGIRAMSDGADSSLCGGAASVAAPSALRRGKYSRYPNPCTRSDVVGGCGGSGGGGRLGATIRHFNGRRDGGSRRRRGQHFCEDGASSPPPPPLPPSGQASSLSLPLPPPPPAVRLPPPAGTVGAHGPILSRTSPRSLLLRRWRSAHWAHVRPARLLVFRSRDDFDAWRRCDELRMPGGGANADADGQATVTAATTRRGWGRRGAGGEGALVKWSVDLDTQGVLAKKEKKVRREVRRMEREERRRLRRIEKEKQKAEKNGGAWAEADTSYDTDDMTNMTIPTYDTHNTAATGATEKSRRKKKKKKKKDRDKDEDEDDNNNEGSEEGSPRESEKNTQKHGGSRVTTTGIDRHAVLKYTMGDVHSKSYGRNAHLLHGFKLECWTRDGASIAAAFASSDPDETRALRKVIQELLELCTKEKKKHGHGHGHCHDEGDGYNNGSVAGSTYYGGTVTHETSVLSGMTGTDLNAVASTSCKSKSKTKANKKAHTAGGGRKLSPVPAAFVKTADQPSPVSIADYADVDYHRHSRFRTKVGASDPSSEVSAVSSGIMSVDVPLLALPHDYTKKGRIDMDDDDGGARLRRHRSKRFGRGPRHAMGGGGGSNLSGTKGSSLVSAS